MYLGVFHVTDRIFFLVMTFHFRMQLHSIPFAFDLLYAEVESC
jgi:hypothetical protein